MGNTHIIHIGSVVGIYVQDGFYRQRSVLEIKDNKVVLSGGVRIDIDKLKQRLVEGYSYPLWCEE